MTNRIQIFRLNLWYNVVNIWIKYDDEMNEVGS